MPSANLPGSLTEEWRPVVGYEGYYEVSNLGRVRNVASGQGRRGDGYILRPLMVGRGSSARLSVHLFVDGVSVQARVHRLVAEAFIRSVLPNEQVHHIDRDPTNNAASNLVPLGTKEHRALHEGLRPSNLHCSLGSHKCRECRKIVRRRYYQRSGN